MIYRVVSIRYEVSTDTIYMHLSAEADSGMKFSLVQLLRVCEGVQSTKFPLFCTLLFTVILYHIHDGGSENKAWRCSLKRVTNVLMVKEISDAMTTDVCAKMNLGCDEIRS